MYQMLIADDDQFVLDGLKEEIDWKKYNIYAVECCTNGKQALEILKQQQIDIILTDIRMPGVDGLELTKAAMEQNPEICVVIMSGHSEFEYAHTAIRLGVYDYLLKPITLDAIDSLFMRLTKELDKEAEVSNREMDHWKPTLVQKYFQDLLNGLPTFLGSETLVCQMPYYQCVLFHIDHYKKMTPVRQQELTSGLFAELYQWGEKKRPIIPTVVKNTDLVMIFQMERLEQKETEKDNLRILKQALEETFMITITIGISRIYSNVADSRIYAEEAYFASRHCHDGDEKIIYYEPRNTLGVIDREQLSRIRGVLFESFHAWNYEKVSEALKEMKMLFDTGEIMNLEELQMLFIEIISKFQMIQMENMPVKKESYPLYEQAGNEVRRAETVDELFGILEHVILESFSDDASPGSKNDRIVRQVIQLIQDNVNTNITLNQIAQEIYISPNYLGCIFKEEIGMSFNEYLQQYRMKLAQKLLKSHKFKVYEISAMVGYKNPSYFTKLFTEYTGGICPSDYEK